MCKDKVIHPYMKTTKLNAYRIIGDNNIIEQYIFCSQIAHEFLGKFQIELLNSYTE